MTIWKEISGQIFKLIFL